MKLTKNFNRIEFDSRDGARMPKNVLERVKVLATNLQVLRDHIGKPIIINSGYRSPSHNSKIGGVPSSKHVLGEAGDLVVKGMSPKKLAKTIIKLIGEGKMTQGGVGLYNTFVHYDIRGVKARWDYSPWYNF